MSRKAKNLITFATSMVVASNIIGGNLPVNAAELVPDTGSEEVVSVAVTDSQVLNSKLSDYKKTIGAYWCSEYSLTDSKGQKCVQLLGSVINTLEKIPTEIISNGVTYRVISLGEGALNNADYYLEGNVVIPEGIVEISDNCAKDNTTIKSISIPTTVTRIGNDAFNNCSTLKTIDFKGSSNIAIGDNAFRNTQISRIEFPAKATLGKGTVSECAKLSSVTLPTNLTEIPERTFSQCKSLQYLQIPATVTQIRDEAFYGDSALALTIDNVTKTPNTSFILPNGVTSIGNNAFAGCTTLSKIDIGENLTEIGRFAFENSGIKNLDLSEKLKLKTIGMSAFRGSAIETIKLPNQVTDIQMETFSGCNNLISVQLPCELKNIDTMAFQDCTSLKSLDLPANVSNLGDIVFLNCGGEEGVSLTLNSLPTHGESYHGISYHRNPNLTGVSSVILNDDIKEIKVEGNSTQGYFEGSSIKNITLPKNTATIFDNSFKDCKQLVKVDQNVADDNTYKLTYICSGAFQGCNSLKEFSFNNGIKTIGDNAFEACMLENLTIPTTVETIGNSAFKNNNKLVEIKLNEGLKSIGAEAFSGDSKATIKVLKDGEVVEGIVRPSTVTYIGNDAFKGVNLKTTYSDNFEYSVIPKTDENGKEIEYADGEIKNIKVTKYFGEDFEKDYANISATFNIKEIADSAFADNTNVKSVVIPESVTSIGKNLFENCTALESVTFKNIITTLPENTFKNCKSLTNVLFAEKEYNVADLSEEDYKKYVKLDEKNKPKFETFKVGLRTIESGAFEGCSVLETLTLPTTLEIVKTGAVKNCPILHNLMFCTSSKDYEKNFTTIEEKAFVNCPLLGYLTSSPTEKDSRYSISIPDSVVNLGNNAFPADTILQNSGFQYKLTESGAYIYKCYGYNYTSVEGKVDANQNEMTKIITIPAKLNGRSIEYIGRDSFNNGSANNVTEKVILSEGIKGIKGHAFYNCGKLSEVSIPSTIESIEDYAFGGTKLENVVMPANVIKGVSTRAFKDSEIKTITTGNYVYKMLFDGSVNDEFTGVEIAKYLDKQNDSVTIPATLNGFKVLGIGESAFAGIDTVKTITVSEGITYIKDHAFKDCTLLSEFRNAEGCTVADNAFEGTSIQTHYDNGIEYKILDDKEIVITKYNGSRTIVAIAEAYNGIKVTSIADNAFNGCTNVTSVTLPDTITNIGASAFSGCSSLATINIPYSVTKIGEKAFSGCIALTKVEIPGKVITINDETFKGCTSLANVIIAPSVATIGTNAFNNCSSMTSISIPASVKVINAGAFVGTKITNVNLPVKINEITLLGSAFNEGTKITYKSDITQYTVRFLDFDGRVINTQTVNSGANAIEAEHPVREGFVFAGWDKPFTNITGDTDITAKYTEAGKVETFKIRFLNYDGTVLSEQVVNKAAAAVAPANPSREGFTFSKWDKDFSNITANMDIQAVYTKNAAPTSDVTSTIPLIATITTGIGMLLAKRKRK